MTNLTAAATSDNLGTLEATACYQVRVMNAAIRHWTIHGGTLDLREDFAKLNTMLALIPSAEQECRESADQAWREAFGEGA